MFHLHYMDFLRSEDKTVDEKFNLIQQWILQDKRDPSISWAPYVISLRAINWLVFFSQNNIVNIVFQQSLFNQCLWLEKYDEKEILANHYFENIKALLFASYYFEGTDANRWRRKSLQNLSLQIKEQVLRDGGHFERSPQYHCRMLENYLDIYNLLISNSNNDLQIVDDLTHAINSGFSFLANICHPDGLIPLFNDSSLNTTSSYTQLLGYANSLGLNPGKLSPSCEVNYCQSGLFAKRSGIDFMVFDCGDIGPHYQPGHTHCDFLSFEMTLKGKRVFVNSGVYEYENTPLRHFLRSTSAHNTVAVDSENQSDVWAQFRVARRAKKAGALLTKKGNSIVFEGEFSGFHSIGPINHHRTIVTTCNNSDERFESVEIIDKLRYSKEKNGKRQHSLRSYLHLHPQVSCMRTGPNSVDLHMDGVKIASLHAEADLSLDIEDSFYYPEFGLKQANKTLVTSKTATLPTQLRCTITIF
jgi:uncharacterized heparinase superfamily protein